MKKLTLSQNFFKEGEVLNRAQLKNVMGGDGSGGSGSPSCKEETYCTLTSAGGVTESGDCSAYGSYVEGHPHVECFCKTPNHQTPTTLSSNGGDSKYNS